MSLAALPAAAAVTGQSSGKDIPSEGSNSSKDQERPLPSPPPDVPPSVPHKTPVRAASVAISSSKASGKRRASRPSRSRGVLAKALKEPAILSRMLSILSWRIFHALASTCREFRQLLEHPQLRDVILSEYVPGYRACLGHASADGLHTVDVDMSDLALLKLSQRLPLHYYPLHALRIVSSSLYNPQIPPNDPLTLRYVSLAHAHSRFVFLLQSLAHGGLAFTSEIDADDYALTPSPAGMPAQALSGLRELVFPKPLSFFDDADQHVDQHVDQLVQPDNSSRKLLRRASATGSTPQRSYSTHTPPRASADFQSLISKKATSKSLLRPVISALGVGQKVPLPPPHANPPALAYHVGAWRRNVVDRRATTKSHHADDHLVSRPGTLPRRSSSTNPSSAEISSLSTGRNSSDDTDSSGSFRESSTPPVFRDTASVSRPSGSLPHDLSMATSRFRAPLLRVFVPCSELDEVSISMCEQQLMEAGLYGFLSTGDIVCNFGYVPRSESDSSQSSDSSGKSVRDGSPHRREWLIFNGYCLVHYIPPSPPPVECSLALPSPFYYSHILPPSTDPRFVMSLPPLSRPRAGPYDAASDEPFAQLTLSHVRTKVVSPHSPLGHAVVKKYMWLARIAYVGPNSGTEAGMRLGEGWQGEWVLEAEGTQEGKQYLLDAVKPGPDGSTRRGLWEIVRDKSGGGRIWIRLIVPNIDSLGPTTPKI